MMNQISTVAIDDVFLKIKRVRKFLWRDFPLFMMRTHFKCIFSVFCHVDPLQTFMEETYKFLQTLEDIDIEKIDFDDFSMNYHPDSIAYVSQNFFQSAMKIFYQVAFQFSGNLFVFRDVDEYLLHLEKVYEENRNEVINEIMKHQYSLDSLNFILEYQDEVIRSLGLNRRELSEELLIFVVSLLDSRNLLYQNNIFRCLDYAGDKIFQRRFSSQVFSQRFIYELENDFEEDSEEEFEEREFLRREELLSLGSRNSLDINSLRPSLYQLKLDIESLYRDGTSSWDTPIDLKFIETLLLISPIFDQKSYDNNLLVSDFLGRLYHFHPDRIQFIAFYHQDELKIIFSPYVDLHDLIHSLHEDTFRIQSLSEIISGEVLDDMVSSMEFHSILLKYIKEFSELNWMLIREIIIWMNEKLTVLTGNSDKLCIDIVYNFKRSWDMKMEYQNRLQEILSGEESIKEVNESFIYRNPITRSMFYAYDLLREYQKSSYDGLIKYISHKE